MLDMVARLFLRSLNDDVCRNRIYCERCYLTVLWNVLQIKHEHFGIKGHFGAATLAWTMFYFLPKVLFPVQQLE